MSAIRHIIRVVFLGALVAGCASIKEGPTTSKQYAALYNPSEFSLNADYRFFHISENMTSMYIRLFPGELLFNQANEQAEYRAMVGITYIIYELDEKGMIAAQSDSTQFEVKLGREAEERSGFFSSKVLNLPAGKHYLIRLEARDLQRGTLGLMYKFVDKKGPLSAQNYSIVSATTGYPRFQSYITPGEVFKIKYRLPGYDTIYIDYLSTPDHIPRPPVTVDSPSSFPFETDTTIALAYSENTVLTVPDRGTYHFRVDTLSNEGVTVHNFGQGFPKVETETALMEPLFYISTMTEYNRMRNQENRKRAVDDFWLQRASSMERSKELIRVYYNRVLYSNLYFTESREGWKSDRGMIFILLGPPDRMRDTGTEQRWYYISRRQGRVVEFVFERKPGAHSNHDLVWMKSNEALQQWSAAVSSWRSGKVYSFNK
ncbi:MAG: GWxTD domain-containing protein [Bacteroidales bacterium]